jgi:G3E family GTPase
VDCQQPFGTERLLPRGTLREPPSHLARASTIFITKSDGNTADLRRRIAQYNPTAGIIECTHHPLYLEDVFTGERVGLESLKGRKVASLSGIAQPESFEQKPRPARRGTGLFQAICGPPSLYAAGDAECHQPQQEAPGRDDCHDAEGCGALPQD